MNVITARPNFRDIMTGLHRFLLARTLPAVLGKAGPETIPRTGAEAFKLDCFYTYLVENGERSIVLTRMRDAHAADGLKHDGRKYSMPVVIPLDRIDPNALEVTHYYGLDEVRYEGLTHVALGLWTRWPYLVLHINRAKQAISQWLFNRRALVVQRRLDTLRAAVEFDSSGDGEVDALNLMTAQYGSRWAGHPDWESLQKQLERHLNYLADTGELERGDWHFKVTGKALATLEAADEEDRKHIANFRVQVVLAILTLVSAAMAASQANLVKFPTLLDLAPPAALASACGAAPSQLVQASPSAAGVAAASSAAHAPSGATAASRPATSQSR